MGCNSSKAVEEPRPDLVRSVESQLWKEDNLFTRKHVADEEEEEAHPNSIKERSFPQEPEQKRPVMTSVEEAPEERPVMTKVEEEPVKAVEPEPVKEEEEPMKQEERVPMTQVDEGPVEEEPVMEEPVKEEGPPVQEPVVEEPAMEEPVMEKEPVVMEPEPPKMEEAPVVVPILPPPPESGFKVDHPPEPALYPGVQEFILSKDPERALYPGVQAFLLSKDPERALYPGVQEFILTGDPPAKEQQEPTMETAEETEEPAPVIVPAPKEETVVAPPPPEKEPALYPAVQDFILSKEPPVGRQITWPPPEQEPAAAPEPVVEEKPREAPKPQPSVVKAPDPRKHFGNKSKVERASIVQLRNRAEVKKNLQLFDSNAPEEGATPEGGSAVADTIAKFGGEAQTLTAVQRRKLELEQKEKENKDGADPKSQLKTTWKNTDGRHGAYKKKVTHKKGPRSKKNLADLP